MTPSRSFTALFCLPLLLSLLLNHATHTDAWSAQPVHRQVTGTAATPASSAGTRQTQRRQVLEQAIGVSSLIFTTTGTVTTVVPSVAHADETQPTTFIDASSSPSYQDGPRGLRYLVTQPGTGTQKPVRAQKIKTSYTLYLKGFPEDGGQKVDSSKTLGIDKPFEFLVGVKQVVPGWDLALMDMTQGESRRLIIPASLGYGEQGAGGKIPGGATLYFEVTLTELGKESKLGPEQLQWLENNPL